MKTSPTLILIHGGQVGAWVWDSVRRQLSTTSIAIDLPAHGRRGGLVPNPGAPLLSSFPSVMRLISTFFLRLTPEFSQPPRVIKTTLLNGMPTALADEAASKFGKESSSLLMDRLNWTGNLAIPITYVRCLKDRGVLSPTFQEQLATRLGPHAAVASIDACHYAMLEKPAEVATLLNSIAQ